VSADNGSSWGEAVLTEPVLAKALTRFRVPWRWSGAPSTLISRATDERGVQQPSRATWLAKYGAGQGYHNNSIQSWQVAADGVVRHVYV